MDTCIILPLLRVWIMKPPQWTLLWNPPSLSMASLHPDRLKVCQAAFLISFGKKSSWIPKIPGVNLPSYRDGRWVLLERWGLGFWMVFVGCWDAVFFFKARIYDFEWSDLMSSLYCSTCVPKCYKQREAWKGCDSGIFPGYVRCFCFGAVEFGMVPHLVESEGVFWFLLLGEGHPPKDMWHSMILDASGLKLTFEMIE